MYDAVTLMADLPYVDQAKIGVSGHSNGARAANFSVAIDNAAEKPLIAAVFVVDNDPVYTDAENDNAYFNLYGTRDTGLVADQYDEFFFRSYSAEGAVLTPPRDYIGTPNAQSFLHYGADPKDISDVREAGTFYTDGANGAIRVTFTPAQTYPWGTISLGTVADQLDFFDEAFGAPTAIDSGAQVWQIKEIFTTLGLIGFAIFLLAFARTLLSTRALAGLKLETPMTVAPNTRAGLGWFWGAMVVSALISGVSYVVMSNTPWIQGIAFNFLPTFFTQGAVFFIAFWAAFNGLAAAIMVISYLLFGRTHGMRARALGLLPGWRKVGLSAALAVVTVAAAYGIVFFLVYFVANSVAVNVFNRFTLRGKEWLNTAVLALVNALAPTVLVVAQYVTFFVSGYTILNFGGLFSIWLFPVIVILAATAVLSRKLYRITGNPYIGGFISAIVVTLISVTNTLTVIY